VGGVLVTLLDWYEFHLLKRGLSLAEVAIYEEVECPGNDFKVIKVRLELRMVGKRLVVFIEGWLVLVFCIWFSYQL